MNNTRHYNTGKLLIITVACWVPALCYMFPPQWSTPLMRLIFKSSPMLFLALWSLQIRKRPNILLALGLVSSAAGDISGDISSGFIASVVSFAIAHILYIAAFTTTVKWQVRNLWLIIPVTTWTSYLAWVLQRSLNLIDPTMKTAIFIYTLIITAMAIIALSRRNSIQSLVTPGAILFVISDSLIALDRFVAPINNAGFLIMLTYQAAQYLIAIGFTADTQTKTSDHQ